MSRTFAKGRLVAYQGKRYTIEYEYGNDVFRIGTADDFCDMVPVSMLTLVYQPGERLWSGDEWCDVQAGCPSIYDTWKRLFGEPLDVTKAVHKDDFGDAMYYYMPNGHCAAICCDGNAIYKTMEVEG